jgi:hypothetical protein
MRSKTHLMEIRPVEAELFHADRRTDKHDDAKRLKMQMFESLGKGKPDEGSIKDLN